MLIGTHLQNIKVSVLKTKKVVTLQVNSLQHWAIPMSDKLVQKFMFSNMSVATSSAVWYWCLHSFAFATLVPSFHSSVDRKVSRNNWALICMKNFLVVKKCT